MKLATAILITASLLFAARAASAAQPSQLPIVAPSDAGATIEAVTIETYGVIRPDGVRPYLSLRRGWRLSQAGVTRDYRNLVRLGGFIPRLQIEPGDVAGDVRLHWIVMSKWLKPTAHPFYGDQPLSAPIEGIGFVVTSQPIGGPNTNLSGYTQLSQRADLARSLFTVPLHIDAESGRETDFIVDGFYARGDLRVSNPIPREVYSWTAVGEVLYLFRSSDGTQYEFGARQQRSTTSLSSGIDAPSVFPTNVAPARNTVLEAGIDHACTTPPTQWYPPYCSLQYRFETFHAIGGMGNTSVYESYLGDIAGYLRAGNSTVALHAAASRTGGVIPDSFLVCAAGLRGYPKPFCGTDGQVLMAEYRIADRLARPIRFVLFTETGSSRVRDGTQPWALPTYTWHPDSGVGVIIHGLRFDVAYGKAGSRLTFGIVGQLF